jgi:hypothetical protein
MAVRSGSDVCAWAVVTSNSGCAYEGANALLVKSWVVEQ